VLDNSKDGSLRASGLEEARTGIAENLMNPRRASNIFHCRSAEVIMLIVAPVMMLNLALEDLPAAIQTWRAGVLLEEGMVGAPNKCRGLARSQLCPNLLYGRLKMVDPRRRLGVQDSVHQRICRPLLKKPLLLLHYDLLVCCCELVHVVGREDCGSGHFLQDCLKEEVVGYCDITQLLVSGSSNSTFLSEMQDKKGILQGTKNK